MVEDMGSSCELVIIDVCGALEIPILANRWDPERGEGLPEREAFREPRPAAHLARTKFPDAGYQSLPVPLSLLPLLRFLFFDFPSRSSFPALLPIGPPRLVGIVPERWFFQFAVFMLPSKALRISVSSRIFTLPNVRK
jgi:hypothetical protein